MSTPAEGFLDAAVHPFADNPELQIHARRELEERIDPAAKDGPSWDAATRQLDKHDRSWWRGKAPYLLPVLLLLAFFTCHYPGLTSLFKATKTLASVSSSSVEGAETSDEMRKRLSAGLDADQQLILFGTSSDQSGTLPGEELWQRHPDNPSYFGAYAVAYASKHKELPPGYLETAGQIDPDNGWFPTFAAVTIAARSVETLPRTEEEKKARKPKRWKILDAAGLDQAVDLVAKAASMPRFESYGGKRFSERMALVPPANDFPSYVTRMVIASGTPANGLELQRLVDVIGPHARRLTAEGKPEELQAFLLVWKTLAPRMLADSKDLIGVVVAHAVSTASVRIFKEATQTLGLTETAEALDRLERSLEADNQKRKATDTEALETLISERGGMLATIALPTLAGQTHTPPVIDEETLKPMRLVDHAWGGRLLGLCAFVFMGIACGLSALYRFRHGRLTRFLSSRMTAMMPPADWAWVLVMGGCGPLLAYEAIQYLTPLGIRSWNLVYALKSKPIPQIHAWMALSVIVPIVVARWRFGIRTRSLGLSHPRPWLGWTVLALCTILLPLSGFFATSELTESWALAWNAAFLLCELWWLATAFRAIFTRQANALGRQTVARMVAAAYGVAMLALSVMVLISRAEERYWLSRDPLMQLKPGQPTALQFEYEVAMSRKAEALEILAPLTEIR